MPREVPKAGAEDPRLASALKTAHRRLDRHLGGGQLLAALALALAAGLTTGFGSSAGLGCGLGALGRARLVGGLFAGLDLGLGLLGHLLHGLDLFGLALGRGRRGLLDLGRLGLGSLGLLGLGLLHLFSRWLFGLGFFSFGFFRLGLFGLLSFRLLLFSLLLFGLLVLGLFGFLGLLGRLFRRLLGRSLSCCNCRRSKEQTEHPRAGPEPVHIHTSAN